MAAPVWGSRGILVGSRYGIPDLAHVSWDFLGVGREVGGFGAFCLVMRSCRPVICEGGPRASEEGEINEVSLPHRSSERCLSGRARRFCRHRRYRWGRLGPPVLLTGFGRRLEGERCRHHPRRWYVLGLGRSIDCSAGTGRRGGLAGRRLQPAGHGQLAGRVPAAVPELCPAVGPLPGTDRLTSRAGGGVQLGFGFRGR